MGIFKDILKDVCGVYKIFFTREPFIKGIMDEVKPKNYQKEIAENTKRIADLMAEQNKGK